MAKNKNRVGEKHVSSVPAIVELHRVASIAGPGLSYGRHIPANQVRHAGQYYIILKKSNGRKLYQSTDYYKRREGALNSVRSTYGKPWDGDYRDYTEDGETWVIGFYHK